jgi:hypothetical protein
MDERTNWLNEQLAAGEDYIELLASLGLTKREAGMLGFVKVGDKVIVKPGRGDNGFAW